MHATRASSNQREKALAAKFYLKEILKTRETYKHEVKMWEWKQKHYEKIKLENKNQINGELFNLMVV